MKTASSISASVRLTPLRSGRRPAAAGKIEGRRRQAGALVDGSSVCRDHMPALISVCNVAAFAASLAASAAAFEAVAALVSFMD